MEERMQNKLRTIVAAIVTPIALLWVLLDALLHGTYGDDSDD